LLNKTTSFSEETLIILKLDSAIDVFVENSDKDQIEVIIKNSHLIQNEVSSIPEKLIAISDVEESFTPIQAF